MVESIRGKQKKTVETPSSETPPTSKTPNTFNFWAAMGITWGFLGFFLTVYGTIWLWSSVGDHSLIRMYRVSDAFQAKVDNPYALPLLTNCLQKALPHRNATIADFSTCLKAMGVRDAPAG